MNRALAAAGPRPAERVAPEERAAVGAPGGSGPLGLGRQHERAPLALAEPPTVRGGIVPGDAERRPVGPRGVHADLGSLDLPVRPRARRLARHHGLHLLRRQRAGPQSIGEEGAVVAHGDLPLGEAVPGIASHPALVPRPGVVGLGVAAQPRVARGDVDEPGADLRVGVERDGRGHHVLLGALDEHGVAGIPFPGVAQNEQVAAHGQRHGAERGGAERDRPVGERAGRGVAGHVFPAAVGAGPEPATLHGGTAGHGVERQAADPG